MKDKARVGVGREKSLCAEERLGIKLAVGIATTRGGPIHRSFNRTLLPPPHRCAARAPALCRAGHIVRLLRRAESAAWRRGNAAEADAAER